MAKKIGKNITPARDAKFVEMSVAEQEIMLLKQGHKAIKALPKEIFDIGHVFTEAGFEIALVGGPVRDAFLGQAVHDFDLTTNALPEQSERLLAQWANTTWDIGKDFGTIGARKGKIIVEVTTYRTDIYTAESRKPAVCYGKELAGDITRRDFTVNAMALRLPNLELVDPCKGITDIAKGILRTPIDPVISFSDDPLRIMRAARFSAQIGFDVDYAALKAMTALANRLEIVSAERICAELSRLLISKYPRRGIEILVHSQTADVVLPELAALQQTVDEHLRHKDVYEHTITVIDQAIDLETDENGAVPGPDLVLRIAALLHDIGKPKTRRYEANGAVTFHQHDIVGARMAAKRLKILRFDKATVKAVSRLVELHLRFHGYGEQKWTDSAVRRYIADAGPLLERLHRITRADCTTRNVRKAQRLAAAYDDLEQRIARIKEQEEIAAIRPDLDGQEIMEILHLKPGPQVGQAYKFILALRMENGPLGKEKAKIELQNWWEQQK